MGEISATTTSITFWVVTTLLTTAVIGVVIAFIIVARNLHNKDKANEKEIKTMIQQDETNLNALGLKLESDLNNQVGQVNNKLVKSIDKANQRIDNVEYTDQQFQDYMEMNNNGMYQLLNGEYPFNSLAVGPATVGTDSNGKFKVDTDTIFTVSSSNLELALGRTPNTSPYVFSEEHGTGNLTLSGPGQFVVGGPGITTGAITGTNAINFSTGRGMSNILVLANGQATISGNVNVSGNVNAPNITTLQEQVTRLNGQLVAVNALLTSEEAWNARH